MFCASWGALVATAGSASKFWPRRTPGLIRCRHLTPEPGCESATVGSRCPKNARRPRGLCSGSVRVARFRRLCGYTAVIKSNGGSKKQSHARTRNPRLCTYTYIYIYVHIYMYIHTIVMVVCTCVCTREDAVSSAAKISAHRWPRHPSTEHGEAVSHPRMRSRVSVRARHMIVVLLFLLLLVALSLSEG